MRRRRRQRGQAALELVAILPALVLIGLIAWWMAVAGYAWMLAGGAARAGARAAEVGAPAGAAVLATLPSGYARGALVTEGADGAVRVRLTVPRVVPFVAPQHVAAEAGGRP